MSVPCVAAAAEGARPGPVAPPAAGSAATTAAAGSAARGRGTCGGTPQ